MIISDLNYLETVDNKISVVGGFSRPIRFTSNISFSSKVGSRVYLTPKSHSAAAEADATAAPLTLGGSSFAQTSTFTAAGILPLGVRDDVIVGSVSSSTSVSAAVG